MFHPTARPRWALLALSTLLCGFLALVAPATAGAQESPTYEVSISGDCPTAPSGLFTLTVTVVNNGADPVDVVALDRNFTVAAGATGSAVFFERDVSSSALANSISVDGEPVGDVLVSTAACVPPELPPSSADVPPSSSGEPPSSSDEPPSSDIDAIPIAAPLNPKFTG